MRVDWEAANEMYRDMFGDDMDLKQCQHVIGMLDDGERHRDRILELSLRNENLSLGEHDCIEANSQED